MKTFKKHISFIICAALLLGMPMSALAEEQTASLTKDESVYLILNPDGSLKEQTVSCWLHSDSGLSGVVDNSNLTDITNIKSDVQPQIDGTSVRWDTADTDVYYNGSSSANPPVSAAITYTLDGNEMSAQDMIGKSGKVSIHVKLTNNVSESKTINGAERTIYTPFAVAGVIDMPVKTFYDVSAENSQIFSESTNQIVSFISIPGLKENFDGILKDELSGIMSQLTDEFTITAQTESFEMPAIAFAATTNISDLKEINLNDKVTEITDGIDELESATSQLKNGTQLLSEALGQFDSKMGELEGSYDEFNSGLAKAVSGAAALQSGTDKLKLAAATLKGKVTNELIPGISGATALEQQLSTKMSALQTQLAGLQLPDMTALQTQLSTAIGTVCDSSSDATIQVLTGGGTLANLTPEQQTAINGARDQIKAAAGTQLTQMMSQLDMSALQNLSASLTDINTLASQLMGSMNTLTSSLYDPNNTDLTNPTTLANAIIALSVGADNLNSGAANLVSGLSTLSSSSGQIESAIASFKDGSDTLSEKSGELDDGMGKFNDEGVSQLSDSEIATDLETALAIKDEMQAQAEAYTSYSGSPEGVSNTLRFIMKTDGITVQEKQNEDQPQNAAAVQQDESIWQKISNFFSGLFQKQ